MEIEISLMERVKELRHQLKQDNFLYLSKLVSDKFINEPRRDDPAYSQKNESNNEAQNELLISM